jgi:membrane protease YdiL (CAAX protease family)
LILLLPALYAALRFGLPGTGALRLRLPRPTPLLVVIPCAAAGLILTTGLYELVSTVLPTGGRAVQSFGDAMLPGSVSMTELLLLYCILPGIVEEFVFRGVLMGSLGLRKGWGPAGAILASAVVFGMFHFLYFRIIPTAFIGVMVGIAVVRSDSLLTGMIWHASSNALALLAAHPSLGMDFLVNPATVPAAAYPAAFAAVFLGLLLMKPPLRRD